MMRLGALTAMATAVSAKVYFSEDFNDESWKSRWTVGSEWKPAHETGEFKWTEGNIGVDKGIQTNPDARFYSLTAPLDSEVKNEGKNLVVSYTVRHDQQLDCGGAYLKLTPPGFDPKKFSGDTPYSIMFGPDICGTSTRRTHVILTYKGENLLTKKNVRMESDNLSHRYTLILRPDNTYTVEIDGEEAESGSLYEDFDFLLPKTIADPDDKKPADWVDEAEIPDPDDKKPADWVDGPAKIPDTSAEKPEDWDDEEDGDWIAPLIDNPDYHGVWKPKMIPNPAYKGPWAPAQIPNPDYVDDDKVHAVCHPCSHIGFELWQVKAGTIFDDIIVTDDINEAKAFADKTWAAKKDAEKKKHDAIQEAKRIEDEKARAEAEAAAAAANADVDDEEEL